jgi:predicted O-methyltransferase YrrM
MSAKHQVGTTLGQHPDLYPYVLDHIDETPIQRELRDNITAMDRSVMMGAPDEAQFLAWLASTINAKHVIEVGVFRGSTTLALALALPADGKVVGLDVSDEFATVGKQAWAKAGVSHKIDFRVGPAIEALNAMLHAEEAGKYDLAFIDADKQGYDLYYEACLKLLRPGGVIAIDNVLWDGRVNKPIADDDSSTRALVEIATKVRGDFRVKAVMLPIADGCYLARKL